MTCESELFSEIYSCYYQVVQKILRKASDYPVNERDMKEIADTYGYEESFLSIVPKLVSGEWALLEKGEDGYRSKVTVFPLPLTTLQRSWLNALLTDQRIRLFFTDEQLERLNAWLQSSKPLFLANDFVYFDQYSDGDPYHSTAYRSHFQQLLYAIRHQHLLDVSYYSVKKHLSCQTILPCRMEYSTKEDKFRLICVSEERDNRPGRLTYLNVARICQIVDTGRVPNELPDPDRLLNESRRREPVTIKIFNERNALERAMLHFACYQKRTEKLASDGTYLCRIYYNAIVETELLIQILSFGPAIKVLGPKSFTDQIRERVKKQRSLLLSPPAQSGPSQIEQ